MHSITKNRLLLGGIILAAAIVAGSVIAYENSSVTYYTDTVNACIWRNGKIVASSSIDSTVAKQSIKRKDERNFLAFAAARRICTARQPLNLHKPGPTVKSS